MKYTWVIRVGKSLAEVSLTFNIYSIFGLSRDNLLF